MSQQAPSQKSSQLLEEVLGFIDHTNGLTSATNSDGSVRIQQQVDGKSFRFKQDDLSEVVNRFDADGKPFIQVNFSSGLKVLLTDSLVGFKPEQVFGLDMSKLPRVVTTPDLVSVLEAIEESLSGDIPQDHEIEILKRVYQAILVGAENAGFELTFERNWITRLAPTRFRASA